MFLASLIDLFVDYSDNAPDSGPYGDHLGASLVALLIIAVIGLKLLADYFSRAARIDRKNRSARGDIGPGML